MNPSETFLQLLRGNTPVLSLAPMQDVTTLEFMRVIARYGGPDVYWTEFFRVHAVSHLEKWILKSITENPTRRPVVAQLIPHTAAITNSTGWFARLDSFHAVHI